MGGGTILEELTSATRVVLGPSPGRGCGSTRGLGLGLPAWTLPSLLATEPSVEEKLQKLHSEIKFALKVDNPVRPSSGCRGHVRPPCPLTTRAS